MTRHCYKLSLYAISRKTDDPSSRNGKKFHFGSEFFSQKIWLHQSLDFMVNYRHVKYQKKTNDPILRKLSDGRMDEQTNEYD